MQRRALRTVGLAMPSLGTHVLYKSVGGRLGGAQRRRTFSGEDDEIHFLPVVVSAISLLWAYPVLAQFGSLAIDSCEDYVARATSQVQIATGCNFEGPR